MYTRLMRHLVQAYIDIFFSKLSFNDKKITGWFKQTIVLFCAYVKKPSIIYSEESKLISYQWRRKFFSIFSMGLEEFKPSGIQCSLNKITALQIY